MVAAAKAGLVSLLSGKCIDTVSVKLPINLDINVKVSKCVLNCDRCLVCVTKDAGDNYINDVTHGLDICVEVEYEYSNKFIIFIIGCEGVGIKDDIPSISEAVLLNLDQNIEDVVDRGIVKIRVTVPKGREVWNRTLNKYVGVVDGISILGEKGIEIPTGNPYYSPYLKHIEKIIEEYSKMYKSICLTLGGKSSKVASELFREVPIIEVGDHLGYAIDKCVEYGIHNIIIVGGIAKMIKVCIGLLMMHSLYVDARIEGFIGLLIKYLINKNIDINYDILKQLVDVKSVRDAFKIIRDLVDLYDFSKFICRLCIERLSERCSRLFNRDINFKVCTLLPDDSVVCL